MSKIIAQAKRIYLREYEDSDLELCLKLTENGNLPSDVLKNESFKKQCTENRLFNNCTFLIFSVDNKFIGEITLQIKENGTDELGICILSEEQHKGYGKEAVITFADYYLKEYGKNELSVRISEENETSIKLFENLGAEYIGNSAFFSEDLLNKLKEVLANKSLISIFNEKNVRDYILHLPIKAK